jgi:hypothetical protein
MHSGIDVAVTEHRVLGVPGDEQHFQLRAELAGRVRHLPAVQSARKPNIGDQQIDADRSTFSPA